MNNGGLLDDKTVPFQAADVATAVRQGNFIRLVGVQPDLAFAALKDRRREALLKAKIDCHRT